MGENTVTRELKKHRIEIENREGVICITIKNRKYSQSLSEYYPIVIDLDKERKIKSIEILSGQIDTIPTKEITIPKPICKEESIKEPTKDEIYTRQAYDPKKGILEIKMYETRDMNLEEKELSTTSKVNKIITIALTKEKELAAIWIKFPPEITKKLNRNEQINEIIETP